MAEKEHTKTAKDRYTILAYMKRLIYDAMRGDEEDMTKEELAQIFHINNEIKMWNRELDRLKCKSIVGSPKLTGTPTGPDIADPTGNLATEISNCEKIIEGKLIEIQIRRGKIIEYINEIEDSLMRQIIFYRNCSLMSWKQISKEIGAGYTDESVRQSYHRYFVG